MAGTYVVYTVAVVYRGCHCSVALLLQSSDELLCMGDVMRASPKQH
jgi:hypothetical protein